MNIWEFSEVLKEISSLSYKLLKGVRHWEANFALNAVYLWNSSMINSKEFIAFWTSYNISMKPFIIIIIF